MICFRAFNVLSNVLSYVANVYPLDGIKRIWWHYYQQCRVSKENRVRTIVYRKTKHQINTASTSIVDSAARKKKGVISSSAFSSTCGILSISQGCQGMEGNTRSIEYVSKFENSMFQQTTWRENRARCDISELRYLDMLYFSCCRYGIQLYHDIIFTSYCTTHKMIPPRYRMGIG